MPGWPKWSRANARGSSHAEDPAPRRTCPLCRREHLWPLSTTTGGQVRTCACGATFASNRTPTWRAP